MLELIASGAIIGEKQMSDSKKNNNISELNAKHPQQNFSSNSNPPALA